MAAIMRCAILIFWILGGAFYGLGQNNVAVPDTVSVFDEYPRELGELRENRFQLRSLNLNDSAASWRKEAPYEYMGYIDSLLRKQASDKPKWKEHQNQTDFSWSGTRWLIMLLAIMGLLGLLYVAFNKGWNRSSKRFGGERILLDNGEDNQLEPQLQMALERNQYRLAVRYLFLLTLQRLHQNNQLQYHKRTTNSQYLAQLSPGPLKAGLSRLMWYFEIVWYGEYTPSKSEFEEIHAAFTHFNQQNW